MYTSPRRRSFGVVGFLGLSVLGSFALASRAIAQETQGGTITINVRDGSGLAIAGAELLIPGTTFHAVSDEHGAFQIRSRKTGVLTVAVRRLGFQPETARVIIAAEAPPSHTITLAPIAEPLTAVVVHAPASRVKDERLEAFARRRALGNGAFFTRDDIDARNPLALSDLLRQVPGIQFSSTRRSRNALRMRGAGQACWPLVYIDGNALTAAEFDIDNVSPSAVEAIEIYPGPASVPSEFMDVRGQATCGVIAIWSRAMNNQSAAASFIESAANSLAHLVDVHEAYTADQVDARVQPTSTAGLEPEYPPALFAAHTNGTVIAEFLVDASGHAVPETFNVIAASNPAFAAAVRRALAGARFEPAVLHGTHVAQVVQQTVRFEVPKD